MRQTHWPVHAPLITRSPAIAVDVNYIIGIGETAGLVQVREGTQQL